MNSNFSFSIKLKGTQSLFVYIYVAINRRYPGSIHVYIHFVCDLGRDLKSTRFIDSFCLLFELRLFWVLLLVGDDVPRPSYKKKILQIFTGILVLRMLTDTEQKIA